VKAYRITNRDHTACDGEGSRLYGGRWNHKGWPVVYFSDSEALAVLEMLANKTLIAPDSFALIEAEIPAEMVDGAHRVEAGDLGVDGEWKSPVAHEQRLTRNIGTEWAREGRSAVMIVPSAVVRTGRNLIVNPRHGDFGDITIDEPRPYGFDRRLLFGRVAGL
jgi:hypothetical protein